MNIAVLSKFQCFNIDFEQVTKNKASNLPTDIQIYFQLCPMRASLANLNNFFDM